MIREVDKMEDKIKIIEIDGVGFSFNANRAHERDGHVYCRQCGEQIDSEPLACLGSKKIIFSRNCRCDRETEAKRKEEEIENHIRRLKEECFATSRNLISYSFEKIIEPERQEVIIAKNFVKNFKELAKNNNGLIFHGNVGTGNLVTRLKLGFSYEDTNVLNYIDKTEVPILIINSKADTVTPYFMGEEIYNTISHSNKEMFTVDDSKHVEIFSNYPREYEKNIIDFIR